MGWRRQRWQEGVDRPVRPKVRSLSVDERVNYLKTVIRAIKRSPVLTALGFDVRILRGRFYVERHSRDADGALIDTEPLERITSQADVAASLLLEVEFRAGSLYDQAKRERRYRLSRNLAGEEKMASMDVTNGNRNDAL